MSNEIAFKLDPDLQVTKAEFTYKITPNTISITDTKPLSNAICENGVMDSGSSNEI
jgi:hypothetical protein